MPPSLDRPVIYLAGPEVFLSNAAEIGQRKIAMCRERGFDARFPLVPLADLPPGTAEERGHEVFERCLDMLCECDLLIANMTPFRGVSMDVGTAVEMAYMFAKGGRQGNGGPVFGYTNVIEDYGARVSRDSLHVESFGFADNVMCEGLVWKSGGTVVRTRAKETERLSDMRGLAAGIEQAISVLGPAPAIGTP